MFETSSAGDIPVIEHLNREMDQSARLGRVNELFLDGCLNSLDKPGPVAGFVHWLTLARLTELTLWCAGGYADAGWFTATGDLMFNPRRKYLVRRNGSRLIELQRHKPVSEQVEGQGLFRNEIRAELKKHFRLVIEKGPLLPDLISRLKTHTVPAETYLGEVESRMRKIASTMCFRATVSLPEGLDLEVFLRLIGEEERRRMISHLCRFDLSLFHRFGERLKIVLGELPPEPFILGAERTESDQRAA